MSRTQQIYDKGNYMAKDYEDGEYRITTDYEKLCHTMLNDIIGMHIVLEEVIDDICDGKEMSAGVKVRELYSAMDERIEAYRKEFAENNDVKD